MPQVAISLPKQDFLEYSMKPTEEQAKIRKAAQEAIITLLRPAENIEIKIRGGECYIPDPDLIKQD